MASSQEYLQFVLEQLSDLEEINYRAMMGEYIIYYRRYKVQNNRAPQDISDLDEYIDVENIKAPTGDVYVNGVLTSNETGENYSLNSDKTNATFMGKTRMEFGKNTGE